jgi:hypothetical protein
LFVASVAIMHRKTNYIFLATQVKSNMWFFSLLTPCFSSLLASENLQTQFFRIFNFNFTFFGEFSPVKKKRVLSRDLLNFTFDLSMNIRKVILLAENQKGAFVNVHDKTYVPMHLVASPQKLWEVPEIYNFRTFPKR